MLLPQLHAHGSVESAVLKTAEFEIVGDDVQHHGHLTENQHLVASLLQFDQHLIQNHHFAANVDDFTRWIVDLAAWIVDEERMGAHLAQQHHDVAQLVIRGIENKGNSLNLNIQTIKFQQTKNENLLASGRDCPI